MAKKVDNPEEREKRIYEIRDYVLEKIDKGETFSTRSIAKYFTENRFTISNNTVDTYLNELKKMDKLSYLKIKEQLDKNKPKTIENEETKKRIMQATKLLLQNQTVEQIAILLNSTNDIIYRDLTFRLPKIETDEEILIAVANMLKKHSLENLKQNKTHR